MKVLIIDDDEAMIGIWSTVLRNGEIDVITAGSGKLGLELAAKNLPDFILCDQIITDMKGNDVLKQLKANPATAKIPVALVSNYSEPEMMHEAIESGAIDYILKYQIDPSDLANKIKTLLHGTKPLNPAPGQPIQQPDAPLATQSTPSVTPASPAPTQGAPAVQQPTPTTPPMQPSQTPPSQPADPMQAQPIQQPSTLPPAPPTNPVPTAPAEPTITPPVNPLGVSLDPTKPQ
ncbi:MAG TPA: response regulator [Patescibacteria group bacterium]|nr:response regulator [Patescibacteria group bacterium]